MGINKKISLCFLSLVLLGCNPLKTTISKGQSNAEKQLFVISNKGSSRATAYINSNKIVESERFLFVVFLENKGNKFIAKLQQYEKMTMKKVAEKTLGETVDNHGCPAILLDSSGYIHVAFGGHGNLWYMNSLAPLSIDKWSEKLEIRSNLEIKTNVDTHLTYPTIIDIDGKILLFARQAVNEKYTIRCFTIKNNKIEKFKDIFRPNSYLWEGELNSSYARFYINALVDDNKTIHLTFQVYEFLPKKYKNVDVENGQTYCIGYLSSEDFGESWKAYGKSISLPATLKDVEIIAGEAMPNDDKTPMHGFGISNLMIDSKNRPCLLYHEMGEKESKVIIAKKKGKWNKKVVNYSKGRGDYFAYPESAFSIAKNGDYHILLTIIDKEDYNNLLGWNAVSSKVSYLILKRGKILKKEMLISNTNGSATWLPSLQRKSIIDNPWGMFMMDGDNKEKNTIYLIKLQR